MAKSKIEWTEESWNTVTGCTKISEGCKNCYAERFSNRLMHIGKQSKYQYGFNKVVLHPNVIKDPFQWKKPKTIFVNSMSDLFHKDVPDDFILKVFDVMNKNDKHIFQVLTKRSERLLKIESKLKWKNNIWMGVSVENAKYINRVEDLIKTDAKIKFLSLEPLIGPIPNLKLDKIDWLIVGGESGPGARQMEENWVLDIRDQCLRSNTPFFFKQWGGVNKKKTGRLLDEKIWEEMPHMDK